jgi:hypothetical protein
LVTVQPESVPDPKTPAAQDVAASDKKNPKISPARNLNMKAAVQFGCPRPAMARRVGDRKQRIRPKYRLTSG